MLSNGLHVRLTFLKKFRVGTLHTQTHFFKNGFEVTPCLLLTSSLQPFSLYSMRTSNLYGSESRRTTVRTKTADQFNSFILQTPGSTSVLPFRFCFALRMLACCEGFQVSQNFCRFFTLSRGRNVLVANLQNQTVNRLQHRAQRKLACVYDRILTF